MDAETTLHQKPKRKPPNAGIGRIKGVPNKLTSDVKAMILAALEGAGGVAYLQRQADENPVAFMALVGKVLPMTVANADGSNLVAPQFIITPVIPADA